MRHLSKAGVMLAPAREHVWGGTKVGFECMGPEFEWMDHCLCAHELQHA